MMRMARLGSIRSASTYAAPRRALATRSASNRDIDVESYPPGAMATGINIVPQGFVMVVERLGKLHSIHQPGLFVSIPFIDRIVAVHDMRELCLPVPPQAATTQDNVRIFLEGNVYIKILDPEKATYKIRRPLYAVLRHAEAAMRASVGLMELDNIFHSRATLNTHTLGHLQEACTNWGLAVARYEVTGVEADSKISEAMDLQAAAERRRRETVKTAMAEKEAAVLESEGQRDKDRNEAEGKKIRAITEAEGFMEEQRLRGEGLKQAKILEAEGLAFALERVGRVAQTEHGQRALQYMFGKEYVAYMSALGSKNNTTIFMPQDVGDISAVLAKGLSLLNSGSFGAPVRPGGNAHTSHAPVASHEQQHQQQQQRSDFGVGDNSLSGVDSDVSGKWAPEIRELQEEMRSFGPKT